MLGLTEVPGKVVVNLCELVSVLRLGTIAPVIEVHHLIEDFRQGLDLILANFLGGVRLLVVLGELFKQVAQLESASRLGRIARVRPAVGLPAVQLGEALVDLLEITNCERQLVF